MLGRGEFKTKTTKGDRQVDPNDVTDRGKRGIFGNIKSLINMSGAPGANSVAFLSLPEILGDGIALGYLFDYLRKVRALKNLQFWLACGTMLEIARCSSLSSSQRP
jgi:hypothetical protein